MDLQIGRKITVFTPTFNRAQTLPRLYQSLIRQTLKNFIWLVIDDGSSDSTKDLLENWILENKISIEYLYKQNGGKHSAMRVAYEIVKTKYLMEVDSDDELMPDALEIFDTYWERIEKQGLEVQIASINAMCVYNDGSLDGDFTLPDGIEFIDCSWHEMVLKRLNNNEYSTCFNFEKLKQKCDIPSNFWYSDRINHLNEFVLWARLGRSYKTRYLNKAVYVVHTDGDHSLLRNPDQHISHYNNLVGTKYFVDENFDFLWWNPKYFFNLILKFIISGIVLHKTPFELLKAIENKRFKMAYLVTFPLGFLAFIYFRYIRRKFWFQ